MPSDRTTSLTERSPRASRSRICRRRGSATALKASELVAERAMRRVYSDMGICQARKRPRRGPAADPFDSGQAGVAGPARGTVQVELPLAAVVVVGQADEH